MQSRLTKSNASYSRWALALLCLTTSLFLSFQAAAFTMEWELNWPNTDFSNAGVDVTQIKSAGPPRDGIPTIYEPKFIPASEVSDLPSTEPVIQVIHDGVAKAYPIRIMIWHEIVNDTIAGLPIVVTYSPLCNVDAVFERAVQDKDGSRQELTFGNTGKLLHANLIFYDRETETWWQQFTGNAIAGKHLEKTLHVVTSQLIPFSEFTEQFPDGLVLKPEDYDSNFYGTNPYIGYDQARSSSLSSIQFDDEFIGPMDYVVVAGGNAWLFSLIRELEKIEHDDLILTWHEGMNSVLQNKEIVKNPDIGFIRVQRKDKDGILTYAPYMTTFAFTYMAFNPKGTILEDTVESSWGKRSAINYMGSGDTMPEGVYESCSDAGAEGGDDASCAVSDGNDDGNENENGAQSCGSCGTASPETTTE